jgi:hypothetical protein
LLIRWVWAGYFSIFVFDNTLGLGWVSFNIRFINTASVCGLAIFQYSFLIILWVLAGYLSILVLVNTLGVARVSLNILLK